MTRAYAQDIWRLLTLHAFPSLGTTLISQITGVACNQLWEDKPVAMALPERLLYEAFRAGHHPLEETLLVLLPRHPVHAHPLATYMTFYGKYAGREIQFFADILNDALERAAT